MEKFLKKFEKLNEDEKNTVAKLSKACRQYFNEGLDFHEKVEISLKNLIQFMGPVYSSLY